MSVLVSCIMSFLANTSIRTKDSEGCSTNLPLIEPSDYIPSIYRDLKTFGLVRNRTVANFRSDFAWDLVALDARMRWGGWPRRNRIFAGGNVDGKYDLITCTDEDTLPKHISATTSKYRYRGRKYYHFKPLCSLNEAGTCSCLINWIQKEFKLQTNNKGNFFLRTTPVKHP